jgi:hypothetical protein
MHNLFFNRGSINDPAHFFGRTQEMRYLCDLLRHGQSVAISGARRIGKTSLLFHVAAPQVMQEHNFDPDPIEWVYLDGQALDGLAAEWLYGAINRELGYEAETLAYTDLVERLRDLTAHGRHLIIVLDEFELFAANPQFQPQVFRRLRGLTSRFSVQFLTASQQPLASLSLNTGEGISSSFFNIFAPLHLGLLQDHEAIEMLQTLSERGGQRFDGETLDFLLELVGPHPLYLQVAGFRAFAALQDGGLTSEARALVVEHVRADLEGHLRYAWDNLSAEEQYALSALPLGVGGPALPVMNRLAGAGLLHQNAYPGAVQRDFVRCQHVNGLIHCGAFLMDDRRRLVMVNDLPVHLTDIEFALLRLFLQNPGQLVTGSDIEAALWPDDPVPDPERARHVITRLRAKLGAAAEAVFNQRGQGYILMCD